jgi:tetratricopeptide (TPR) repeat protein
VTVTQLVGLASARYDLHLVRLRQLVWRVSLAFLAMSPHLGLAQNTSSVPPPAQTEPAPAPPVPAGGAVEQVRLVYEQAALAYSEHRYKDAILLFQQADGLRPNPAFSFNIGIAYEDMGDSAMALHYYRTYLRQLPKAADRDEVDQRIRRLERLLADKGLQQVTILSNPASAVVKLDGKPRGVTPWTGEVAAGLHTVMLSLNGYEDETREFDLPPTRAIDVPITLHAPRAKSKSGFVNLNEPEAPAADLAPWQHVRPVTWAVFGAGVAAVGGALGFELARAGFEERSQRSTEPTARTDLHERAQRHEVWAKGLLMLGLGLGLTSIVLGYQDIDDGLSRQRVGVCLDWVPGEQGTLAVSGAF